MAGAIPVKLHVLFVAISGAIIAFYYSKLVDINSAYRSRGSAGDAAPEGPRWLTNDERVMREMELLLAAEAMLARHAAYFEKRLQEGEDAIANGLAVYPAPGTGLGFRSRSDAKDFPEDLSTWPDGIGSVGPAFGLPPRGVMRSYEIHNSRQRIRVVKGSVTWHVQRRGNDWEATTIHANPISTAPLPEEALTAAYHVVDAGLYHVVENAGDSIAVVVTWHEADPVETKHVQWSDTDAADSISTYWRRF